jgi:excisionase family DNA binding protein
MFVNPELTAKEVAARFNVSPYTVKAWCRNGLFPNARLEENLLGSVWLIPESDLKGFVKPERGRPPKTKQK